MKPACNKYCSRCLSTRRFFEVDDHYECEQCRKMLFKVVHPEGLPRPVK